MSRLCSVLLTLAALLPATALRAQEPAEAQPDDVLVLRNGDRLSGTIDAITADGIELEAAALGGDAVLLGLDELDAVVVHTVQKLQTADGEVVEGPVDADLQRGTLRVELPGGDIRELAIADLVEVAPPTVWSGSLNIGAALATGNTERRSASTAAEISRRSSVDRLSLGATWDYAEEKPADSNDFNLTQRRTYGEGQYDYFFSERLYALAQLSGENDEIANLDLRLTAGTGLGYQWIERETLSFSTEAGVSYISERRGGTADNEYLAARIATALEWQLAEDLTLLHDAQLYPSFEDGDDLYGRSDTRLRTTLLDDLFAQLQWIFDFDNTPSPGLERQDHRLLLSIGWSF